MSRAMALGVRTGQTALRVSCERRLSSMVWFRTLFSRGAETSNGGAAMGVAGKVAILAAFAATPVAVLNSLSRNEERESAVLPTTGGRLEEAYTVQGGRRLGTGHFGTVSTAVHKTSGEVVAVKALPRGKAPDDHVLQEIETHREAGQHPNIIGLKGVYSDDHHYYMVMDLAPGGELYNHLTKEGMLGDREVRFLMREISGAVAHLHDKGIVHFDIKPENILLGSPDQVPCKEAGIGGGGATSRPGGVAGECLGAGVRCDSRGGKGRAGVGMVQGQGQGEGELLLTSPELEGEVAAEVASAAQGPLALSLRPLSLGEGEGEGEACRESGECDTAGGDSASTLCGVSRVGKGLLSDFGSSFRLEKMEKAKQRALKDYTAAYSAPEVISAGEVDQKADVWSLGVIAYIMVKGTHPFDPTSKAGDEEIAANVRQAEPDWEGVEPRAANLLRRMLARNPADRPSAREVLESPWLRQIDQDP